MWISDKNHEEVYGDKAVAAEMKLDQLTKKLYCGLEYLSVDFGDASTGQSFNWKELEKQKDPEWPTIMKVLAKSKI